VRSKGELLRDIVLSTLDAVLAAQTDAVAAPTMWSSSCARTAETQVRYFARFPRQSIVTTRDFAWADDADLPSILVRRNDYRHRIEEMLERGEREGVFVVDSSKVGAFAIIEMCEAVPTWFRPTASYPRSGWLLVREYAVRIAGISPGVECRKLAPRR